MRFIVVFLIAVPLLGICQNATLDITPGFDASLMYSETRIYKHTGLEVGYNGRNYRMSLIGSYELSLAEPKDFWGGDMDYLLGANYYPFLISQTEKLPINIIGHFEGWYTRRTLGRVYDIHAGATISHTFGKDILFSPFFTVYYHYQDSARDNIESSNRSDTYYNIGFDLKKGNYFLQVYHGERNLIDRFELNIGYCF